MLCYVALSPHPPAIIPAIGGDRLNEIRLTLESLQQIAQEIKESAPETIVFLTPHGNVFSNCLTCLPGSELKGDFGQFGHPEISFSVANDVELLQELTNESFKKGIEFAVLDVEIIRHNQLNPYLDHGIMVPLYYLQAAGLQDFKVMPVSIGYLPLLTLYRFGQAITEAARRMRRKIAVVASGDMSHRLKDEGPYAYHPDGVKFDHLMYEYLKTGDVKSLMNIPAKIRDNAGECGYRSVVIMLGSLDGYEFKQTVCTYEGPFGVGYLTAGFRPGQAKASLFEKLREDQEKKYEHQREKESMPVRWARMVLESYIKNGEIPDLPTELRDLKTDKGAVFVSLKKNGQLRGCIGTIMPVYDSLAAEIAHNAVSAGTRDPRFLPVQTGELRDLVYSVDILSVPEKCSREELDPRKYGVIVSKGARRGLLLPDLDGVDTVEQQLAIALQKGGIDAHEQFSIERFEVKRYV